MKDYVSWKIGGEAGFGIMAAGTMLSRAFARHGYHTVAANEYPSLIRGGHNVITVGIGTAPFDALRQSLDILVALNKETVAFHASELHEGSIVIFDPKDASQEDFKLPVPVDFIAIPMTQIVNEKKGDAVMRNTVALGATIALLGVDLSYLSDVITTQFEKKGEQVIDENIQLAKAGFDAVKSGFTKDTYHLAPATGNGNQLIMNASEAVGIGAIDGGMKFAAIYPMTPINALIGLFADHEKELGITYVQPEDEIAGINMALGAAISGVRSMVATSGGGFALMVEGVSLAGITEVPVVIDLGMRPGPATGMPTYTEQGELLFAMFSGHGEFPRIILAPGDVAESYQLSKQAFDLAEQYQTPVFVLTDKYLNENQWCVSASVFADPKPPVPGKRVNDDAMPANFKRYDLSAADGISPRSVPGQKDGLFITNSYEHDEQGFTTEDSGMRVRMAAKRMKKLEAMKREAPLPTRYGDADSSITFVTFGSTKGPVLEAMKFLKQQGISVSCLHFTWVYPLDGAKVGELLKKEKRLVVLEQNGTGQLAKYLRMETGLPLAETMLKNDGREWFPEEIVKAVGGGK